MDQAEDVLATWLPAEEFWAHFRENRARQVLVEREISPLQIRKGDYAKATIWKLMVLPSRTEYLPGPVIHLSTNGDLKELAECIESIAKFLCWDCMFTVLVKGNHSVLASALAKVKSEQVQEFIKDFGFFQVTRYGDDESFDGVLVMANTSKDSKSEPVRCISYWAVNLLDNCGQTPFHSLIRDLTVDDVGQLLEFDGGGKIDLALARERNGLTLLQLSASLGFKAVSLWLLERSSNRRAAILCKGLPDLDHSTPERTND